MAKNSSKFLLYFLQKRFISDASGSSLPQSSLYTIEFLKNSCGFTSESALSAHRKIQLDETKSPKYESVLNLLKSHRFEDPQIAKLIEKWPSILRSGVDNNLKPKLEFLEEIGFVGPLLSKVILSNLAILKGSLDSRLKPSVCFIKEMLESNEKVIAAACRSSWILTIGKGRMRSNIDVLLREGVPSRNISKLIMANPRTIMLKVDRMVFAVSKAKELGIDPTTPMFVHAVRVIVCMNESTWEKKVNVLKSLGWSEEDVSTALKRYPLFFGYSEEKMRAVTDFCLNTAGLGQETLISYPKIFMHGIEKRLRPRYKVLKALKENNLMKKNRNIARLFLEVERIFLKNYVLKHLDKIPDLLDIYRGNSAGETGSAV